MDKGYISLWRSIQDNEMWFEEPFTRAQAWIDLLLLANHKTTYMRVRGIRLEVERGQIGRSKETLADRWKWSRSKVMRFLDELENDGMIEQQTSIKNSRLPRIISIVNYEKYQQNEQQKDNKKTLNEQQKDTNNNVNKLNNENKNNTNVLQKEKTYKSENVLNFWNQKGIIQHKISDKIEKAYLKAKKEFSEDEIIKAISNYKEILDSSFYYSHKFTLENFLKQSNGIHNFIEGGETYENYKCRDLKILPLKATQIKRTCDICDPGKGMLTLQNGQKIECLHDRELNREEIRKCMMISSIVS